MPSTVPPAVLTTAVTLVNTVAPGHLIHGSTALDGQLVLVAATADPSTLL